MRALARSGRRAEALDAYRRAHRTLADQLGIQPGPELRELHQRILAGDEEQPHAGDPASSSWPVRTSGQAPVGAGQVARRTTWSGFVVPRQLPAATGHFTGRQAELDTLVDLLASADRAEETVVISAIDGMAGVDKTALAVHWAQLHAAAFPDGQLYIDLRGYTHGQRPRTPDEALTWLLRALGVPAEQVPADDEQAVALEGLGACHLVNGDVDAAGSQLRRALEIYQRLGMTASACRVQRSLTGLTLPSSPGAVTIRR
jgi:hypothetical protein